MQPTIVGTVVALVASAGVLSSAATAAADDKVVLGSGAGIVVDGRYCTLATIGHDHVGDLVGFTAGHCGGPGATVVAKGADNHGPVGTVAAVGDGLDYGVIKFDPAKVMPTGCLWWPVTERTKEVAQPCASATGVWGSACGNRHMSCCTRPFLTGRDSQN